MASTDIYKEIGAAIDRAYQSRTTPMFAFQKEIFETRPYKKLEDSFSNIAELEDITDINVDVSFAYVLRRGARAWLLRISMVGRYAILLDVSDPRQSGLIVCGEVESDKFSVKIIKILTDNNIEILSKEILEKPTCLALFATDKENVRVYQALFSDNDVLPWDLCVAY